LRAVVFLETRPSGHLCIGIVSNATESSIIVEYYMENEICDRGIWFLTRPLPNGAFLYIGI
jgi:hypothetical protein